MVKFDARKIQEAFTKPVWAHYHTPMLKAAMLRAAAKIRSMEPVDYSKIEKRFTVEDGAQIKRAGQWVTDPEHYIVGTLHHLIHDRKYNFTDYQLRQILS